MVAVQYRRVFHLRAAIALFLGINFPGMADLGNPGQALCGISLGIHHLGENEIQCLRGIFPHHDPARAGPRGALLWALDLGDCPPRPRCVVQKLRLRGSHALPGATQPMGSTEEVVELTRDDEEGFDTQSEMRPPSGGAEEGQVLPGLGLTVPHLPPTVLPLLAVLDTKHVQVERE